MILESFPPSQQDVNACSGNEWKLPGKSHLYTPEEWRVRQLSKIKKKLAKSSNLGITAIPPLAAADAADAADAAVVGSPLRVWVIDMAGHFVAGVSGKVRLKSDGKKERKEENFILLLNSTKGCMLDWQMPHFLYDELFMSDLAEDDDCGSRRGSSSGKISNSVAPTADDRAAASSSGSVLQVSGSKQFAIHLLTFATIIYMLYARGFPFYSIFFEANTLAAGSVGGDVPLNGGLSEDPSKDDIEEFIFREQ